MLVLGVGFRPMPDNKDIESTLIWFRHGEETMANWQPWVDRLEEHMKVRPENLQYHLNVQSLLGLQEYVLHKW